MNVPNCTTAPALALPNATASAGISLIYKVLNKLKGVVSQDWGGGGLQMVSFDRLKVRSIFGSH
jgi:hypothetical protein